MCQCFNHPAFEAEKVIGGWIKLSFLGTFYYYWIEPWSKRKLLCCARLWQKVDGTLFRAGACSLDANDNRLFTFFRLSSFEPLELTLTMHNDTRSWLQHQFKGLLLLVTLSIVLAAGFNTFRKDGIPWFEDWDARMRARTLPEGITGISSEEARNLFQSGAALFLDARDSEGFVEGHIKGALNLPINQFETVFPNLADRLSQAALIVTYCSDVTCHMSDELAQSLLLNGFSNVLVYLGGVEEWEQMGQPLETGSID